MALISRIGSWHSSIKQVKTKLVLQVTWAKEWHIFRSFGIQIDLNEPPVPFQTRQPDRLALAVPGEGGGQNLGRSSCRPIMTWLIGWIFKKQFEYWIFPRNIAVSIIETKHAFMMKRIKRCDDKKNRTHLCSIILLYNVIWMLCLLALVVIPPPAHGLYTNDVYVSILIHGISWRLSCVVCLSAFLTVQALNSRYFQQSGKM